MVLVLVWLFGSIGKGIRMPILTDPTSYRNKSSVSALPSFVSVGGSY